MFETHLLNFCKDVENLANLQAKVKNATKLIWHEIIDRNHSHAAPLELVSNDKGWRAFQ